MKNSKPYAELVTQAKEATKAIKDPELGRDRKGQHSIAVNDQWRICFRFVDGDAYDVEITDYH